MKLIKKILLINYIIILIGVINKVFIIHEGLNNCIIFGFLILIPTIIIYIITSLIKKQERINALILLFSLPAITAFYFVLMFWIGSSQMTIIGSSFLLITSTGILIFSIIQKRNILNAILFFSLGIGSLYLCFRILIWPYSNFFIAPILITLCIATIFKIKKQIKLKTKSFVMLSMIGLLIITFIINDSSFYKFCYLNNFNEKANNPEILYDYAWYLHIENENEKALDKIETAINQLENNEFLYELSEYDKSLLLKKYQNTIKKIKTNNWNNFN